MQTLSNILAQILNFRSFSPSEIECFWCWVDCKGFYCQGLPKMSWPPVFLILPVFRQKQNFLEPTVVIVLHTQFSTVEHDHISLQCLQLIDSENGRLLNLCKACMCSTIYVTPGVCIQLRNQFIVTIYCYFCWTFGTVVIMLYFMQYYCLDLYIWS